MPQEKYLQDRLLDQSQYGISAIFAIGDSLIPYQEKVRTTISFMQPYFTELLSSVSLQHPIPTASGRKAAIPFTWRDLPGRLACPDSRCTSALEPRGLFPV
jgi:hypothetical protein